MKQKWYLSDWFIGILFFLWPLYGIPLVIGIILLTIKHSLTKKQFMQTEEQLNQLTLQKQTLLNQLNKEKEQLRNLTEENALLLNNINQSNKEKEQSTEQLKNLTEENTLLLNNINALQEKLTSLNASEYFEVEERIKQAYTDLDKYSSNKTQLLLEIERLTLENNKLLKSIESSKKKLSQIKDLYSSIKYTLDNFFDTDEFSPSYIDYTKFEKSINEINPSVILKLHCMDIRDLKKAFKNNEKEIDTILEQYSSRYTTKANKSIYKLMVIALRAELQNILYSLKYEKLEDAVEQVKSVTQKYLSIASDGNQNIAVTLTKFIGQVEYLFLNSVKIEYNYYVKKEQARQEQLALREQMRQEAEERKALENERKKIAKEEEKYNNEISKVQETLTQSTDKSDIEKLQARILELQNQLGQVIIKKDEITNLQNGKAGTVYIISNLGSFGEDIFKIGMTRRIDPQDRINELGSASVPFKFDVHSFIFSDDAVSLESKMHKLLNDRRVNKVNLRKEFFRISIDELESLVNEIDPSAEFNKTMVAEEFRQSISSNEIYSSDYHSSDIEFSEN